MSLLSRDQVLALILGQLVSLLLTGTGITSQLLSMRGMNVPTGQSLINYVLLCIVFTIPLLRRGTFLETLKSKWKYYIPLALFDVEGNYFAVKAYQYTNITSAMLLNSFSIPCAVFLTYFFLKARYNLRHGAGVAICVAGLGILVFTDVADQNPSEEASNPVIGDIFALIGALLYACANVGAEAFVKKFDMFEYLSQLGLYGSIIGSIQFAVLERDELSRFSGDLQSISLVCAYAMFLFAIYSIIPIALVKGGAALFNLSILTSGAFAVVAAIFLFDTKLTVFFFVSLGTTISGLLLYNIKNPPITEYDTLEEVKAEGEDEGNPQILSIPSPNIGGKAEEAKLVSSAIGQELTSLEALNV